MIIFNECAITPDGKHLVVEVSVNSLSYYDKVFIKSITVDTEKTYLQSGTPSNEPIVEFEDSDNKKHVRFCWNATELGVDNLNDHIFIVYVRAGGYPAPDTPCTCDHEYSMAVAVNLKPIYDESMRYMRELDSDCAVPMGMIDYILRLKAFKLSLKTGNMMTAFNHWSKLFRNKKSTVIPSKNCGCHGIN